MSAIKEVSNGRGPDLAAVAPVVAPTTIPREWRGEKIITTHVYPPIPIRSMDWQAVTENYDAELVDGRWVSHHPMGNGPTEAAAIADLIEQLEERALADAPLEDVLHLSRPYTGRGDIPGR